MTSTMLGEKLFIIEGKPRKVYAKSPTKSSPQSPILIKPKKEGLSKVQDLVRT